VIAVPRGSPAAVSAPPARASGDALEAELAQVDRARAALSGGRWGEAFSESQRYESDHPRGRLLQEALLIRMRALERMGDAADARAIARRLIRMSPSSPHAAQARALLAAAGEIP
jgi:outer membrane protein assembly factor BamD (BamD/ComL family)